MSVGARFKKWMLLHFGVTKWVLIITEPWTVDTEPPPMTRIILEPWTATVEPPEMERIILEPWTS